MILLSDNDIIGKLAACDLLDLALEALEATREEVYVLGTARFALGVSGKKKKARFDETTLERIGAFLASVRVLDEGTLADVSELNMVPGIDAGEAILFAATAGFPVFRLATDDRKSLRALLAAAPGGPVVTRLTGRVITFLPLVRRLIDQCGFDLVRERVVPARQCDTSLRALFGSGMDATEANVLAGLASDLRQLREEVGVLLVPD